MGLTMVENLSGLCGNAFGLFRSPQFHFNNRKLVELYLNLAISPIPPVWGPVLLSCNCQEADAELLQAPRAGQPIPEHTVSPPGS